MASFGWEGEGNHGSLDIAHRQPRQRWSAQVAADRPLTIIRTQIGFLVFYYHVCASAGTFCCSAVAKLQIEEADAHPNAYHAHEFMDFTDSSEWEQETQMVARLTATCAGGPVIFPIIGPPRSVARWLSRLGKKSHGVLQRVCARGV